MTTTHNREWHRWLDDCERECPPSLSWNALCITIPVYGLWRAGITPTDLMRVLEQLANNHQLTADDRLAILDSLLERKAA